VPCNSRLKDWIEDLGSMPSLCTHTSYDTSRPLSYILSDFGHVYNSFDWADSFDKLKKALNYIPLIGYSWGTPLDSYYLNFCEDCS